MDYLKSISVLLKLFIFGQHLFVIVNGACSWPTSFISSQWHDSARGVLTFGTTNMQGWSFTPTTGTSVSSWDCVTNSTYTTDGRLIMITANSFTLFSTSYYAYLCITITQVTSVSYRYYINHEIQNNVNYERLFIYPVKTLTDPGTICSSNGATGGEYIMLIKQGSQPSAKIYCPWYFLGTYGYTHTPYQGVTSCDKTNSKMDLCANTKEISFDYTQCQTKVAYSASNTVWCVDNVPSGGVNYVMLYNGLDATVDSVTTFEFTCMAVSEDAFNASVSPRYCQPGQTPYAYPSKPSGIPTGARLSLSPPRVTCPTCPVLTMPPYGNVTVSTTGSVTTSTYACDQNYTLWGSNTRICQDSTMTWTGAMPTCSCSVPPVPTNGGATVNSNGSVVTYTCSAGYTLNGLASRNCQLTTATWQGTDPTCTQCASLLTIGGQSKSVSTNGTITSVAFGCVVGYTLVGTASLTCNASGSWDGQQPNCVQCPVLTNQPSGYVTTVTSGTVTTATYACATGYTLQGSTTRTCLQNATWTSSEPVCICNDPTSPANGAVVANGSLATYTCNSGFTISGDSVRTCQVDGSGWTSTDPKCTKCSTLTTVTGGSYALSTTGTVTSAKYTCIVGYSLDGVSTITCQADGSWSSVSPTCVQCPTLDAPSSGTVTLSTSGTKTSATYACASGYNLNGNTIRLCNSDGTWSLMAPTCTCQSPVTPMNGAVVANGVTANYTCSRGYSLNGASTRTCGVNGTGWSGADPTCSTCATLSTPTGGTVTLSTDGINTKAAYNCSSGYTLNGVTPITCRSDGSWDFSAPTCAKCPDLTDPGSGTVTLSNTGSVTTATFSCATGYYLSGSFTLTCGADGKWSSNAPTCKCNFPTQPSNGLVIVSGSGQLATYTCDTGYSLSGLATRGCLSDGTGWEGADPKCTVCQTLSNPTSGVFSIDSNGTHTTAMFTCNAGTTMDGDRLLACKADGSWSAASPTCASCPTLTNPDSGTVSLATDGMTTTATFSCVTGYVLNSTSILTCQSTGSWDIASPVCVCQSPGAITNGQLNISADLRTATYTCNVGYVLVGSSSRTCLNKGQGWSGIAPVCVLCPSLTYPTVGSLSISTNGTQTVATYTCPSGYDLNGNATRTCNPDGSWTPAAPTCTCTSPSPPGNGQVSADGYTATYSCNQGYSLNGLTTRTCRTDGTGWSGAPPTCSTCATLTTPTGGSVNLSTNGINTQAFYTCNVGYTLSGTSSITCRSDGTWNFTPPSCIKCPTLTDPNSGTVSLSTNGQITTASFSCQTDYFLSGAFTLTCSTAGTWSGSSPTCKCNFPTQPSNGQVTLSNSGQIATYRCNVGYTLDGLSSRNCQTDGSGWEGTDPQCQLCTALSNPASGGFALGTNGTHTTTQYSCNVGTALDGDSTSLCKSDGSWDSLAPVCVSCTQLFTQASGAVSLTTNGLTTTATFSCVSGYTLNSTGVLTCTTSGDWDLPSPYCICQSPSLIANGVLDISTDLRIATYTCNVGYILVGSDTRTCQDNGTGWDGISPVCETCRTLSNPVGGSFSLTSDGLTTYANYSCVSGYTLVGSRERTCQQNKSYTPAAPTCVKCTTLSNFGSGNITVTTDGFTSTALYTCATGYRLVGTSTRTCKTDGTWTVTAPVCECETPNSPLNGALIANGKTANYTCDVGHTLLGQQTRTCNTDGTGWSDGDPQCIMCQQLQNPVGGLFTLDTSGTQTFALFYCENGYTLKGTYKVYCLNTGNWESLPTCTKCNTLSAPSSGSISTTTTGRITTVTYTCATGYDLYGNNVRNCLPDGSWDLTEPNCTCQSPVPIQHGSITSNGLTAKYTCDVGYSLDGSVTRACATDGSGWSGPDPKCNPCVTLTPVTGGTVSMVTDGQETHALYKCSVGYTLNGQENITCRSDGTWDFSQPQCVMCPTLSNPGSGNVTMTTNSKTTTATFTCATGYYVSGLLSITCLTTGQWSLTPPTCKCISPSSPSHGSVSVSDTSQGPVANYICQLGYSISGPVSRLCRNDGSGWEGVDPSCNMCRSIMTPLSLTFTTSTNGSVTVGKYACALNYTLSGESVHICLANGSWQHSMPSCVLCSSLSAPLSGAVTFNTDGLQTTATFSCLSGYMLDSLGVLDCLSDGSWDRPAPVCICEPPAALLNGDFDLQNAGWVANFSCDDGYELVGPEERFCLMDGTGWNGTQPRCDLLEPNPYVGESTDNTILAIPVGGFIALVIIVILLVVALVVIAICSYMRYRKERHKIGTTVAHGGKVTEEQRRFNFETSELENGKSSLLPVDANTAFNAKKLKNRKMPGLVHDTHKMNGDIHTGESDRHSLSSTLLADKDQGSQASLLSTKLNGTLPTIPLSSVRLPKLPPRPAKPVVEPEVTTTRVSRLKRKRRKLDRKESTKPETPPLKKDGDDASIKISDSPVVSSPSVVSPNRPNSTPIEIKMKGTFTPEILSAETFEYLQPVYCHEATPSNSRPTTGISRTTIRTAKSAPSTLLHDSDSISESNV